MLVDGPSPGSPNWDRVWRCHLVDNLSILVKQLWQVGITEIFVGGSFAEDRDHPSDIDGYFICCVPEFVSREPSGLAQRLNRIDPQKLWSFDGGKAMRNYYHVHLWASLPGQNAGIPGPNREDQDWPTALRRSKRQFKPRGVIKIEGGP